MTGGMMGQNSMMGTGPRMMGMGNQTAMMQMTGVGSVLG